MPQISPPDPLPELSITPKVPSSCSSALPNTLQSRTSVRIYSNVDLALPTSKWCSAAALLEIDSRENQTVAAQRLDGLAAPRRSAGPAHDQTHAGLDHNKEK